MIFGDFWGHSLALPRLGIRLVLLGHTKKVIKGEDVTILSHIFEQEDEGIFEEQPFYFQSSWYSKIFKDHRNKHRSFFKPIALTKSSKKNENLFTKTYQNTSPKHLGRFLNPFSWDVFLFPPTVLFSVFGSSGLSSTRLGCTSSSLQTVWSSTPCLGKAQGSGFTGWSGGCKDFCFGVNRFFFGVKMESFKKENVNYNPS